MQEEQLPELMTALKPRDYSEWIYICKMNQPASYYFKRTSTAASPAFKYQVKHIWYKNKHVWFVRIWLTIQQAEILHTRNMIKTNKNRHWQIIHQFPFATLHAFITNICTEQKLLN